MAVEPEWLLNAALTPLAKQELNEFMNRIDTIEAQINHTPLSILVWGPGEKGPEKAFYETRCQIREELRRLGNVALFSEELQSYKQAEVPAPIHELAQAISADFIVALMTSWGSLAEVTLYRSDPELAAKMLVLLPEDARGGFAEQALAGQAPNNLIYFNKQDLESGNVITSVIERIPYLKCAKFMFFRQERRWGSVR